jgi:hypothetical protein
LNAAKASHLGKDSRAQVEGAQAVCATPQDYGQQLGRGEGARPVVAESFARSLHRRKVGDAYCVAVVIAQAGKSPGNQIRPSSLSDGLSIDGNDASSVRCLSICSADTAASNASSLLTATLFHFSCRAG